MPNANPIFGGETPLTYMTKGGVPAMLRVRQLVAARNIAILKDIINDLGDRPTFCLSLQKDRVALIGRVSARCRLAAVPQRLA